MTPVCKFIPPEFIRYMYSGIVPDFVKVSGFVPDGQRSKTVTSSVRVHSSY